MYEVIGIERRQYTNKQGRQVSGYNLFLTYEKKNCDGLACFEQWSGDGPVKDSGVDVGDKVVFSYNRYGKLESICIV